MKKNFLFSMVLFFVAHACAQQIPAFKSLRYDENYNYLKKDSSRNWYAKLKYTTLSQNSYISFGGDIRYQYFNVKKENWGDVPKDADGYIFCRTLLHADFYTGKYFRFFAQLQSSMVNGKPVSTTLDEDPLELHQAFADLVFLNDSSKKILLRLGRQEMLYGSQRLVSVRDGPNNRQSFDAAKLMFSRKNISADIFYSNYVKNKKGIFNDAFKNDDTRFWGGYVVKNKVRWISNLDIYYLGLQRQRAVFNDGAAKETRHSLGARIWENKKRINYDVEGLWQFGKFGDKKIGAWTLSANISHKIQPRWRSPELAIKTEWITGDAHLGDNKLQTFNPLFPRGGYFGLASIIGPANLFDVHPSVMVPIKKKLFADLDYDIFWRYSRNDGIYNPGVFLIYPGNDHESKFIGRQLTADLVYLPNNFLYFRSEFTWFDAGAFLKQAGTGKDILFMGITAQLRF